MEEQNRRVKFPKVGFRDSRKISTRDFFGSSMFRVIFIIARLTASISSAVAPNLKVWAGVWAVPYWFAAAVAVGTGSAVTTKAMRKLCLINPPTSEDKWNIHAKN